MRTAVACIILGVVALLSVAAIAGPSITIYTDAETYQSGDAIEVSLSAQNLNAGMSVDVYVGLLTPDGGLYTLSPYGQNGWSGNLEAWIPEIYVPSSFNMNRTPFFWFDVPCSMPPISDEGDYNFAAVLTRAGTMQWVSDLSSAPFTVGASPASHYYVDAQAGDDDNDGSEGFPWKTITHALASVESSEANPVTIHVAAGTYSASTNGETFPLSMKDYVSLTLSGEGADSTILDAEQDARHVIYCAGIRGLTIMTIKGFTITGASSSGGGGGIYALQSSLTIQNNIIAGNLVDGVGGGISSNASSLAISNNTIAGNSAARGGGISCTVGGPLTIENNIITGNSAARGGGIYCFGNSPIISDNTILGNVAQCGGGISCSKSSPTIENNTIRENSATYDGGGIHCDTSSAYIENNIITGNSAGRGGGISCHETSSPRISNNTISGNLAPHGGGIYQDWDSSPTVIDCIIWANGDDLYGCSATYCCIEDSDGGIGNIHDDPMFVVGPLGEYYLHPDSPCIDAGSQSAAEAGLSDRTTQADETPDTGTVDMGYHYPIP